MFENNDFKIYKMSNNLKIERYEKMKKNWLSHVANKFFLNAIKNKNYKIIKHTIDWTAKKRQSQIQQWIN